MKMNKKDLHYGKALAKYIKENGVKKKFVFEKLGISKPTFDLRLIDGDFTIAQKELINKYYL